MPTYEVAQRFRKDLENLTPEQRAQFQDALTKFVADMKAGKGFRKGLRVKGVKGAQGVFEMTWAPNGRATFSYGKSRKHDEPHVIWRRVGTHDILG